jgi:hypothetical protein
VGNVIKMPDEYLAPIVKCYFCGSTEYQLTTDKPGDDCSLITGIECTGCNTLIRFNIPVQMQETMMWVGDKKGDDGERD